MQRGLYTDKRPCFYSELGRTRNGGEEVEFEQECRGKTRSVHFPATVVQIVRVCTKALALPGVDPPPRP